VAIGPVIGEITPTTNGSAANAVMLNDAAANKPQPRRFKQTSGFIAYPL
jgi:hypothetical protein